MSDGERAGKNRRKRGKEDVEAEKKARIGRSRSMRDRIKRGKKSRRGECSGGSGGSKG